MTAKREKQVQLKDPAIMHTLLKNPQRRARLTDELLSVLQQADGLEIDVENLRAKDRDAFSQWIRELAGELHAHQKMLSVVVQPRTQDKIKDGAGAMDWSALRAVADQVKVMAYHFHHAHGDPGPVAPPEWVVQLVRFAQPSIPPEKLSVVLTLSGFDWPKNSAGRAISFEEAIAKSKQAGAAVERDPATGTPHFEYTENGIRHTVWFEDAVSLRKKIDALHEAGVFQIALWRLGTGDSAFWDSLIKTGP
jgi:spore germination protein YaaH